MHNLLAHAIDEQFSFCAAYLGFELLSEEWGEKCQATARLLSNSKMEMTMTDEDEDQRSIITSAVNAHGILFKKAVRRELEQVGNVSIIGEEYPVRFGDGAQLDLLVQYQSKHQVYVVVAECKRAYATYKKWVFFESREDRTKLPYFFEGGELRVGDGKSFTGAGIPLCVEGIELDLGKYKKSDDAYKLGSIDRIWQTAYQVCRGYHNLIASEFEARKNAQSSSLPNLVFLPVIITTAELFVCLVQDQKADLLSGNSIGNLVLQDVPYVILNHPFTPSAQLGRKHLRVDLPDYQSLFNRGVHSQEGIFVISAENITSFFCVLR